MSSPAMSGAPSHLEEVKDPEGEPKTRKESRPVISRMRPLRRRSMSSARAASGVMPKALAAALGRSAGVWTRRSARAGRTELGLSLVCLGTKDALYVLQSQEQLRNRFEPVPLPRWQFADPEYLKLLNSFAYVLPLRRPSYLADPPLAKRIFALGEGLIGEIATVLRRAAALAVKSGAEHITWSLLDRLDYTPPSRRQDLQLLDIE
jgi:hypothetical protein